MKQNLYCLALLSLSLFSAWAQPAADPINYEARVKSVATLKEHIAAREERFELLKKDLLAKDERLEKQVDSIIKQLAEITDSQDSRTKVANMKDHVIGGLIRNIWVFRQKRMTVFERMRRENIVPKEELEKTLAAFDAHINKRVSQVMELAKSYPGHEDLNKYESYGSSYYNGYTHEDVRISEDWKQNRRDNTSGRQVRKEVLTDLEKAIETNQTRRALILNNLGSKKLRTTKNPCSRRNSAVSMQPSTISATNAVNWSCQKAEPARKSAVMKRTMSSKCSKMHAPIFRAIFPPSCRSTMTSKPNARVFTD